MVLIMVENGLKKKKKEQSNSSFTFVMDFIRKYVFSNDLICENNLIEERSKNK